jgi:hypothetical protein
MNDLIILDIHMASGCYFTTSWNCNPRGHKVEIGLPVSLRKNEALLQRDRKIMLIFKRLLLYERQRTNR